MSIHNVLFYFLKQVEPNLLLRLHNAAKEVPPPKTSDLLVGDLVEISKALSLVLEESARESAIPDFSRFFHEYPIAATPSPPLHDIPMSIQEIKEVKGKPKKHRGQTISENSLVEEFEDWERSLWEDK